jgi:GNAT superfamily N-acetyltransferase
VSFEAQPLVVAKPERSLSGAGAALWLDHVFGRSGNERHAVELPMLMADEPRTLRRMSFDESGPVAHAAAVLRRVRLRDVQGKPVSREITAAFVGAVAVAKRARGRGFAKRVVAATLDDARLRGADVAVLWSEADALYRSLGFEPAGVEVACALPNAGFPRPPKARLRAARLVDFPTIVAMREARASIVRRDAATWRVLRSLPGAKWYVLEEGGLRLGYVVYERGADLKNVIHEWGGDDARFADAVAGLFALTGKDEIYAVLPRWSDVALAALRERGAQIV